MPKPENLGLAGEGLRSRKQTRTRRELEAAAFALFEAKGYEATTVEEISAAVEVSPRTFFRYFGSKEEVLFGYEEDQLAELRTIIRDCPTAATDPAALREALLTFARYLSEEHQPLLVRAAVVAENPSLQDRSLRVLRAWQLTLAEELARQLDMKGPDLRLLVIATSTMGALNVAAREWLASGGQGSLLTVARRALDLALDPRGLSRRGLQRSKRR